MPTSDRLSITPGGRPHSTPGVAATTQRRPRAKPQRTGRDRGYIVKCDRCTQPSVVAWVHPILGGRLEMCVRHSRKHRDALVRQGWLKVARVAEQV